MKNFYTLTIVFCFFAFAKAQTVDPDLITNIKQNDITETSDLDDVVGTPFEGSLLYDDTRTGAYVYDGTQWRRIYFAPVIFPKTADYTLQASDDGNVLTFNSAVDVTLTVPAGLDEGFNVSIYQTGAGEVTIVTDTGATILNRLLRFKTAGPNAGVGLICTSADTYHVTGDLKRG